MKNTERKSFIGTDNPALSFITPTKIDETSSINTNENYVYNTQYTDNTDNVQYTDNTHKSHEKKSKRLNLLLPPSLHKEITEIAWSERVSVNELIVKTLRKLSDDLSSGHR